MDERNIRLVVAYDGTAYSGWQIQPSVPTVQGEIERVLARITQQPCRLRAAGRTDAGVHAEGQLATVRLATTISCKKLRRGLNALLPADIRVHSTTETSWDFDPRYNNRGKHYRYTIHNAPELPPPLRDRAHHVYGDLDLSAMARAAAKLVGEHDFAAFRSASCDRETTVRTIYRCTVSQSQQDVLIDVEGTAFLKNMVRIIAGTLLDIGQQRLQPELIEELLQSGDRTRGGITAPARGLCMMRVFL